MIKDWNINVLDTNLAFSNAHKLHVREYMLVIIKLSLS